MVNHEQESPFPRTYHNLVGNVNLIESQRFDSEDDIVTVIALIAQGTSVFTQLEGMGYVLPEDIRQTLKRAREILTRARA